MVSMGAGILIGIGAVVGVAAVILFIFVFYQPSSEFKKQFDIQFSQYSAMGLQECKALLHIGDEKASKAGSSNVYKYDLSTNPATVSGTNDGFMQFTEEGSQFQVVQLYFEFNGGNAGEINQCARSSALNSIISAAMPWWSGENECKETRYSKAFDNWASCYFSDDKGEERFSAGGNGLRMTVTRHPQEFMDLVIERGR